MKPKPKSLKLSRETLSLLDSHELKWCGGRRKVDVPPELLCLPHVPLLREPRLRRLVGPLEISLPSAPLQAGRRSP